MIYGHRNDPEGFHRCLREFDRALPGPARGAAARRPAGAQLRPRLRPDDAVDRPLARVRAAGRPHPRGGAHPAAGTTATSPTSAPPCAAGWATAAPADAGCPGAPIPLGLMRAVDVIARKRDGGAHPPEEIRFLVDGAVDGTVRDEQLSRLGWPSCCAGSTTTRSTPCARPWSSRATSIDLSSLGRPAVDKHSTGGVGDKVTIALAPLVAAWAARREDVRPRTRPKRLDVV